MNAPIIYNRRGQPPAPKLKDLVKYPVQGLASLDSAENIFFARELEHIIAEMFETDHARINARNIFPIDRSAGSTAKNVTWRQTTKVGQAKIITDYADDIPLVNSFAEELTSRIRAIAVAAMWSMEEIAQSQSVGRPLDRSDAEAARETMLRKENTIAFQGDAAHGLAGLFTDTNIPRTTVATGVGGVTWALKTGEEMVDDMCACVNAIPTNTGDVEAPTRLLLPTTQYNLAACKRMSPGTDTTALNYFIANNTYVKDVMPIRELTGAGTAGVDVMLAYEPNISKIRMIVAQEIMQRPPQEVNLATKVIWHSRFGGVIVHKPLSLHICQGI